MYLNKVYLINNDIHSTSINYRIEVLSIWRHRELAFKIWICQNTALTVRAAIRKKGSYIPSGYVKTRKQTLSLINRVGLLKGQTNIVKTEKWVLGRNFKKISRMSTLVCNVKWPKSRRNWLSYVDESLVLIGILTFGASRSMSRVNLYSRNYKNA